ncbi:MAG: GIY-YIG nuclease family protein [Archaeoglobaceae archaeon]
MSSLKGSYLLILHLKSAKEIRIGKLGGINFNPGYYIYTGSAMNGLENRVKRHFSHDKKLWWHIDYLTVNANPLHALGIPHKKVECFLAEHFSARFAKIKSFGCSDCKCDSHLFYSPKDPGKSIFKVVSDIDLDWKNMIYYDKDALK